MLGNSEYSITWGWPWFKQKTPTFYSGFDFRIDLEAIWVFDLIAKPTSVGSDIFNNM